MIKDHHEGYISWTEYERNQKQLAINAYGQAGGPKSGRGGRALLAGMLTCGRCGRRVAVSYTGNPQSRPVYRCDKQNLMMGLPRCMIFGGPRVDATVARELLRAVEPMAIEAALEAERMHRERQDEQQRVLDLELQQARYEANLAERRYAACDPDNRLIAAQLERNWEIARSAAFSPNTEPSLHTVLPNSVGGSQTSGGAMSVTSATWSEVSLASCRLSWSSSIAGSRPGIGGSANSTAVARYANVSAKSKASAH